MKNLGIIVLSIMLCLPAARAAADYGDALFEAIQMEDRAKVEALLANGVNVNIRDKNGDTPLHVALHLQISDQTLYEYPGGLAGPAVGWGPDPIAQRQRLKGLVELLLAKGADVNAKNNVGQTPLRVAQINGHSDIAKLLRARGAKE